MRGKLILSVYVVVLMVVLCLTILAPRNRAAGSPTIVVNPSHFQRWADEAHVRTPDIHVRVVLGHHCKKFVCYRKGPSPTIWLDPHAYVDQMTGVLNLHAMRWDFYVALGGLLGRGNPEDYAYCAMYFGTGHNYVPRLRPVCEGLR